MDMLDDMLVVSVHGGVLQSSLCDKALVHMQVLLCWCKRPEAHLHLH